MRLIARLRAVVTNQAPGFAGAPLRGHRSAAIAKASCAASSARSKSPRSRSCSQDTAPLVAEGLLEDRYHSTIGRTSIAPPIRAAGTREASSIAASRTVLHAHGGCHVGLRRPAGFEVSRLQGFLAL